MRTIKNIVQTIFYFTLIILLYYFFIKDTIIEQDLNNVKDDVKRKVEKKELF